MSRDGRFGNVGLPIVFGGIIVCFRIHGSKILQGSMETPGVLKRVKNSQAEAFNGKGTEYPSEHFPLHLTTIQYHQLKDEALQKLAKGNPLYTQKTFTANAKDLDILVFKDDRIVVPRQLQKRTIRWYHDTLMHPGQTRTEATIAQHFYWKGLRNDIVEHCSKCSVCQKTKREDKRYGLLPVKPEPETVPWKTLCIDLIGPYSIGQDKTQRIKSKTTGKWSCNVGAILLYFTSALLLTKKDQGSYAMLEVSLSEGDAC